MADRPTEEEKVRANIAHRHAAVRTEYERGDECVLALSGEGPRAHEWIDKPHRIAYDLVIERAELRAQIRTLKADLADAREAERFATDRLAVSSADLAAEREARERAEAACDELREACRLGCIDCGFPDQCTAEDYRCPLKDERDRAALEER